MFAQLTSLTGGGGISASASASSSADGDAYFNNGDFNYKSGGAGNAQFDIKTVAIVAAVGIAAYLALKK